MPPEPAQVTYSVGGQLSGLGTGKTVVIADASGPSASLSTNGSYSLRLAAGTVYSLRVQAQPTGQTCNLTNGSGTATADVNNVTMTCLDNEVPAQAQTVTGSVAGLQAGSSVVLRLISANNSTQDPTVRADGRFAFAQPVLGAYSITVLTQPSGQSCAVANGQGQVQPGSPSASVVVTCATSAYKLSGRLRGSLGQVVLRNSVNADTLTLNSNGDFTFAQPVLHGGRYAVSAISSGASQMCTASSGTGTAVADVTQLTVDCEDTSPPPPPPAPVAIPAVPTLTLGYDVKTFKLSWTTVSAPTGGGAVSYKVTEDPDGAGPQTDTQLATGLSTTSYDRVVTGLLHTRLNATYRVSACNSAGCSAWSAAQTVDLTRAIGYFKAGNTGDSDEFGYSMSMSGDGNTLAVGAIYEDSNATGINGDQTNNAAGDSGAVYIFSRSGSMWIQQAYVKASNTESDDRFGFSVSLSGDGNTLAVGAILEDSNATGANGDQTSNSMVNSGAVYIYARSGSTWSQQAYIKASNPGPVDFFGRSVSLSGDGSTLAVGADWESSNATGINGDQTNNASGASGAVYVFTRSGSTWSQQAYVKASNTGANDKFGYSVSLQPTAAPWL
ncbi:FG-GAP repeat protein [Acidovorax sp. LjRoot194]|uniref:FG-GAP repeat protein n=1 Tax=Acidovorax sp. LjRoot194 TaxID=3342280 RepID=UPI003ECF4D3D